MWNPRLGSQQLVIDAPSEGAAFDLLTSAANQLALSIANWRFKEAKRLVTIHSYQPLQKTVMP
ncbi:MAG: hypothetical protein WBG73_23235 [Coleofasciculaceae cyanobacterium]